MDILQLVLVFVSGIFIMLAAIMNATMDVTDQKFAQTIFVDMFKRGFFNFSNVFYLLEYPPLRVSFQY